MFAIQIREFQPLNRHSPRFEAFPEMGKVAPQATDEGAPFLTNNDRGTF